MHDRLFKLPNLLRKCTDIHASGLGGTASLFRDISGIFGDPPRILSPYSAVLGGSTRPFIVRSLSLRGLHMLFGYPTHLAKPINRWWFIFDL